MFFSSKSAELSSETCAIRFLWWFCVDMHAVLFFLKVISRRIIFDWSHSAWISQVPYSTWKRVKKQALTSIATKISRPNKCISWLVRCWVWISFGLIWWDSYAFVLLSWTSQNIGTRRHESVGCPGLQVAIIILRNTLKALGVVRRRLHQKFHPS